MKYILFGLTIFLAFSSSAKADEACAVDKKGSEMTTEEALAYYECIRPQLIEAYQKREAGIAAEYLDWKPVATGPAAPGFHSSRMLMTYANDVAYDTYVKYETEGVEFEKGSILAKESYKVARNGNARVGPLFLMEKVGIEERPDTDGWLYTQVSNKGKFRESNQKLCHGCHQAWPGQDAMGYPAAEVRLSNLD